MAAEWVSLLRHGVLDADVYPDKATVIIDMLWSAAGHASHKVPLVVFRLLTSMNFMICDDHIVTLQDQM